MRAECLRGLTPDWTWQWVDTDAAVIGSPRMWQSAAYRLKLGPAVSSLNELVLAQIRSCTFDLVWVDKAVFLWPDTVATLRSATKRLVHFTPDAAFHTGSSRFFERTLGLYDLLVTTKTFEKGEYSRRVSRDSVLLTTQGYDARVHYPRSEDDLRRKEVVFVGLAEKDREECIEFLLDRGIRVRVAGIGWNALLRRRRDDDNLTFEGGGLFGDEYANLLSRSWIGLGLLSKRFPELHTTRTFEIPACGAVLATERTSDTVGFFSEDEVIFFTHYAELGERIKDLFADGMEQTLGEMATRGRLRAAEDGRDYMSILNGVLADPRIG
jgi:spore maturation protein CgeB